MGWQKTVGITKEQVESVYKEYSCKTGGKLLGLSRTSFHRLLKKFDIPRRSRLEGLRFVVAKMTVEQRVKMTEPCRKSPPWNKGRKGVMPPVWNKGQRGLVSQEIRLKISEGTRKAMAHPDVKKKVRAHRLSQVFPRKDTIIERKLQKELKLRGIVFETHKPVLGICQPDIVFPEKHIAVFADGHYWHKVHEGAGAKDTFQTMMLCANSWKVLRFSEHQIKTDVKSCVDIIEETVLQTISCGRVLGE